MSSVPRVKKRLLREVVRENVFLVQGKRPPVRHAWARLYGVVRMGFFVVAPLALFVLTYVAGHAMAERRAESGEAAAGEATAGDAAPGDTPLADRRASSPAAATLVSTAGFAAPEPIARQVLPLSLRRIVLDPGHGGENEGTASRDGLLEKELTLDIAGRLRELLEAASFEVVMTRQEDVMLSLTQRGELANRREGDIFVSIHVNWLGDPDARGVETYYLGPTDDPYVERLAAAENADGSLRLAEYRAAVERIYAGMRRAESRALAEAVQRSLLASLRSRDPAVRDRGVKSAPFGVLIHTQMPAILAEVGALSSKVDSELLRNPSYRQDLAAALFAGIRSYSETLSEGPV